MLHNACLSYLTIKLGKEIWYHEKKEISKNCAYYFTLCFD